MGDVAEELFYDNLVLTPHYEPDAGGPTVAIVAGASAFVVGDKFTMSLSPTGSPVSGSLVVATDRMLDTYVPGVDIPTVASSPHVADSEIT
jgi:hypothetical protein